MSSIPFMPLWVGDFMQKTSDLDARETGAYMLLLMAMWSRDGSLSSDQKKLQRVAKCGREWPSVWASISHYFQELDGCITQDRLSEELVKARAKREVNQHNGGLGGRAKALKDKELPLANATVSPQQSYSETESKKEIGKPISVKPSETAMECIAHFNAVADQAGWPQVQKLTSSRKAALSQRISDVGGADAWREAIDRAARSPLLTGKTGGNWRADFDWLCKPANFTKLMEGNYDPRTNVSAITSQGTKRPDPALEQIARLAGLGATPGGGRGGVGSSGEEDGPLRMGA